VRVRKDAKKSERRSVARNASGDEEVLQRVGVRGSLRWGWRRPQVSRRVVWEQECDVCAPVASGWECGVCVPVMRGARRSGGCRRRKPRYRFAWEAKILLEKKKEEEAARQVG